MDQSTLSVLNVPIRESFGAYSTHLLGMLAPSYISPCPQVSGTQHILSK